MLVNVANVSFGINADVIYLTNKFHFFSKRMRLDLKLIYLAMGVLTKNGLLRKYFVSRHTRSV